METQVDALLYSLYRNVVENIAPETGSGHLWETVGEVEDYLFTKGLIFRKPETATN